MLKGMMVVVTFIVAASPVMAQKCDTSRPATAPLSRFEATTNGSMKDTKTRLVWLRCSLGMSWNGSSCEGQTLTYTWREAVTEVNELNARKAAGRSDWRLPSMDELQSIVEFRCFKPAINLQAFPYTPESGFWTDTVSEGVSPRVIVVLFLHGKAYIANKNQRWRVRPVAGN